MGEPSLSTHVKSFAIVAVVLFAGAALAGCTQSTRTPGDTQQGVAFVRRSCGEDLPESGVMGGSADVARSDRALAAASAVAVDQQPTELVVGTFLPLTGDLAAFGPDMQRGAQLAADQINEATGSPMRVRLVHGDDKTDASQAPAGFQDLVSQGAKAVVGAAASSVTNAILDGAIQSKVVVITPASTSPSLTLERNNQGYFYRVPPSDALQGKVLADLVWGDGCQRVGVIAVNNPYGNGLGSVFRESFQAKGGTVTEFVRYDEKATTFTSEVQQVARNDPDAIVLVGYPDTGSQIVKEAFRQGKMKKSVWFFSEGLKDQKFVDLAGKAQNPETNREEFILAGLRGTAPESVQGGALDLFKQAWSVEFPDDTDGPGLFAAESYDAVMLAALGTARSLSTHPGEVRGEFIKDEIRDVANKGAGDTPVTGATITTGLALAATGGSVDYQGAAGDFDFDANGDPTSGIYSFWKVNDDGSLQTTRSGIEPGKPPR